MGECEVHFTYLDLMRHVRPYNLCGDIHFAVFGSFDAIHVEHFPITMKEMDASKLMNKACKDEIPGPFEQMKKAHETRNGNNAWESEHQPIFLASIDDSYKLLDPNDMPDGLDEKEKLEYHTYPLLLSMIQLEKKEISGITFEELIRSVNDQLRTYLPDKNGTKTYGACFFNVGQADLTLVIRCPVLNSAAKAILAFWNNDICVGDHTIRIKSTSSHCAFRMYCGKPGTENEIQAQTELRSALEKWLTRESEQNPRISFRTDYVFTDEYNSITQENDKKVLLGDLDLTDHLFDLENYKYTANKIADIFIYHNFHPHSCATPGKRFDNKKYISSFTTPMIELKGFHLKEREASPESSKDLEKGPEKRLDSSFKKLIKNISKIGDRLEDQRYFINQIKTISMTLLGMLKYLYRLKAACFEYDLSSYTIPAFEVLIKITDQLAQIAEGTKAEDIHLYASEFTVHSIALITEFQHLFSVLSISPNTFMETYSSSMRSLNAASTLLTAYQGILTYLNRKLPTSYYIDGPEGDLCKLTAKHATILIPYRTTPSSNIILYPSFSPEWRLALFHVDFTRMFNLKYTLFMLGHELGHMLGDQIRELRAKLFSQVVLIQYVEQNVFQWYFARPVEAFLTLGDQDSAGSHKEPEEIEKAIKINTGLNDKDWSYFYQILFKELKVALKVQILKHTGRLAKEFMKQYDEMRRDINSSEQLKGYYLDEIVRHLNNFMKEIYHLNSRNPHYKELSEILSDVYSQLAMKAEDILTGRPHNALYFNRLRAFYTASYREEILHQRMLQNIKVKSEVLLQYIEDTFHDIYADVFACHLLKVKRSDYASMLKDFAGCEVSRVVLTPGNLIRYAIVYTVVFNRNIDQAIFENEFKLPKDKAEQCNNLLKECQGSNTYALYKRFALECSKKTSKNFEQLCNEPQLQAIRTMYGNKHLYSCEVMDAIIKMYSEVFMGEI